MLTIFHSWYQAHAALADGILFAMVGLVALSWLVTLARRLWELLERVVCRQSLCRTGPSG